MSVYLVTWEINKAKPNYSDAREKFMERVKRHDYIKDPGLDSVVFIYTTLNVQQIYADLRVALDDNDNIFITKLVSGNHQGWLSKKVWEWINARL